VDRQALAALNARPGGQVRHPPVGLEVLGTAIWIAAVIEAVHADEDVARAQRLRPREREGEEDGVPRRHVGDRDLLRHRLRRAVLGYGDVVGQGGAAEGAEVEGDDDVAGDAERGGHAAGRLELGRVALAILEGEGEDVEPLGAREGERGRGIHAAAQQDDGSPALGHGVRP